MRVSLGLEVVQSGGEGIAEPLCWPVYVAVDDPAMRFLVGDVGSSDWLVAPGALGKGELPAWTREVAAGGLAGPGYIGFGLMYSDGGEREDATLAAYADLVATVQTLALEHAAQSSGMAAMLGGFGGTPVDDGTPDKPGESRLDRLRDGLDPEELRKELDDGLVTGIGALRSVGELLLPFTPGVTATALQPRGKVAAPPVKRARRAAALDPGTVVAMTVQAWRVEDLAEKPLEFRRELPVRGGLKVSLTLLGRVGREDQR